MTDTDLASRVLAELGHVRGDVVGMRAEVKTIGCAVVRLEAHHEETGRRLGALEGWRDKSEDDAANTGQHQIARLTDELATIRRRRLDMIAKSGLLVVGAVVASLVPALLRALGL